MIKNLKSIQMDPGDLLFLFKKTLGASRARVEYPLLKMSVSAHVSVCCDTRAIIKRN